MTALSLRQPSGGPTLESHRHQCHKFLPPKQHLSRRHRLIPSDTQQISQIQLNNDQEMPDPAIFHRATHSKYLSLVPHHYLGGFATIQPEHHQSCLNEVERLIQIQRHSDAPPKWTPSGYDDRGHPDRSVHFLAARLQTLQIIRSHHAPISSWFDCKYNHENVRSHAAQSPQQQQNCRCLPTLCSRRCCSKTGATDPAHGETGQRWPNHRIQHRWLHFHELR